ncbi:MAG: ATP-binding protein [Microthrixaceae bacterium]
MRPLDGVRSIKLKLSLVIVAAVAITAMVSMVGLRMGIPVWARPIISAGIALALVYPLARGLTSPLREMAAAARAMADGHYEHPVTSTSADEVGDLARAFDAMRAQLAQVDRERRDLVANVSHELRTPLAGLRARFENIADGVEAADAPNVEATLAEIGRLSRLVDQLLDLSRIESGGAPLELGEVDVVALLNDVADDLRFHDPTAAVEVVADPGVSCRGDEAKLRQVVINLLHNATRHSPPGEAIELTATAAEGNLLLTVADHGPGIPPEDRQRVFQRFYRSQAGRESDSGGAGLGLAITAGLVDLHGGTIRALANQPTGCRMVVTLPDTA